jgi:hypothetical protein
VFGLLLGTMVRELVGATKVQKLSSPIVPLAEWLSKGSAAPRCVLVGDRNTTAVLFSSAVRTPPT